MIMKTRVCASWSLPALVLGAGLLSGCNADAPPTNLPESKPATPEEAKKAAASVEAGRAGYKPPGVDTPGKK
jgi:hypothetical protein